MNIVIYILVVALASPLLALARSLRPSSSDSMLLINNFLQKSSPNEPENSEGPLLAELAIQAASLNLANSVLTEIVSTIGLYQAAISEWLAAVNVITSGATFELGIIPLLQMLYSDSPTNRASIEKALQRSIVLLDEGNASRLLEKAMSDVDLLLPLFKSIMF
jgi:hypothetical protein